MSAGPPEAVRLRLRDGRRANCVLSAGEQIELWTEALHGGRPGLVEVVPGRRDGSGRLSVSQRREAKFLEAGDRGAFRKTAEAFMRARLEVFATPATLTRAEAANDAVAESAVVWVDVDDPEELGRLRGFPYRPHMVVRSGGSGGLHGFWKLAKPISREELASANRKLAAALRGDRQSTNPARVMRVPSLNRKRYPPRWCRIVMCDLARPGYDVEQLCAGLKDPREPVRVARSPYRGGVRSAELEAIDAALNAIPPPVYFARIAGIAVPERGGEVSCPHADHPDRHPSAMVYPNPGEGWCCFSCGAGGGAIHLVSALRGGPTRGLGGAEFWDAAREALGRLSLEIPESLTQEGRSRGREGVRS